MSTNQSVHSVLERVDAVKGKLSSAEYKAIVDALQELHSKSDVGKLYRIRYQVVKAYAGPVHFCDGTTKSLIAHEDDFNTIVEVVAGPDARSRVTQCHTPLILRELRSSRLSNDFHAKISDDLEKKGFSSWSDVNTGLQSSGPWAGVNEDSSDLLLKLFVVECKEFKNE